MPRINNYEQAVKIRQRADLLYFVTQRKFANMLGYGNPPHQHTDAKN